MEWEMDERAACPQRLVQRAFVLLSPTQGPGLPSMISDPELTTVLGGRHNGWLTLSPYLCSTICNCDRWQLGRATCEKGQRQWKDQSREKGVASGFQIQVTSEFWIGKIDSPPLFLSSNTGWTPSSAHHGGLWRHGCFRPVCSTKCARHTDDVCKGDVRIPEVISSFLEMPTSGVGSTDLDLTI